MLTRTSGCRRPRRRLLIKPVPLESVSVIAEEPRYVAATRLDKIGRIWAPVTVNGEGPFRLVLATGASHTALTPHLAEALGVRADPAATVMLRGATGSVAVPVVPVETLEIGDFLMEPRRLAVIPDALGGADGVLGMDGLANKRIHIDFRHDRITIMRSKNQRAGSGFMTIPVNMLHGLLVVDAVHGRRAGEGHHRHRRTGDARQPGAAPRARGTPRERRAGRQARPGLRVDARHAGRHAPGDARARARNPR